MLSNPNNLDLGDSTLEELDEKLKDARMILARKTSQGGAPFYFSFCFGKENILSNISFEIKDKNNKIIDVWNTAATSGKEYYWHPDIIKILNPFELSIFFRHETGHIILGHCDLNRIGKRNPQIWRIASDYTINAIIEHDLRTAGYLGMSVNASYSDNNHPIWCGNIPKPRSLSDFIKRVKAQLMGKEVVYERRIFADYSLYGQSVEDIYDIINELFKDQEKGKIDSILNGCSSFDEHVETETDEQELLEELEKAAERSERLAGSIPSDIANKIHQLKNPVLKFDDIVRNLINHKKKEAGKINDWSRFRRRGISIGQYQPKKKDHYVKWICLLDTSGSMSNNDLNYGLSQLKCLDKRSKGFVVCCDAITHWETLKEINKAEELEDIKIVGGGGTAFASFFNEYKNYVKDIDIIIIISDCQVFDLNIIKNPGVDVVWVNTAKVSWAPPFGRAAPLK